jgi:hypothetical protein
MKRTSFAVVLVLVTAALVLVFRGGVSANPASRALTVLALVENGTLRADRWFDLSTDQALVDGHVYSDKPPLSSFVVVPFYWLWRVLRPGPYTPDNVGIVVALGDVLAAALPLGAFVLLLERRAARAVRPGEAVAIALLAALGTPLLSYGGTYFGHVLGGTLFVFAYHFATTASAAPAPTVQSEARRLRRHAFFAGLLSGLAVMTELTTWIGVVALLLLLARRPKDGLAVLYVLGGVPCAIAFAGYNAAVTGSPFDWAYAHVTSVFYDPHPLRVDAHTGSILRVLLFSEYRGLFFYAPALLVLAPLAFARTSPAPQRWLVVGFCCAHVLFIASFVFWAGGWCIGPRHLTAVLMVLLYEGVATLALSTRRWRIAFATTACLGLALNLVAVATNPPVERDTHPFRDLFWPAFVRGEMTPDSVFDDLGLNWGRAVVYVWLGLFVVAAALLAWLAERPARS